jgi:hypothetical protein
MNVIAPQIRFREARERAGLSQYDIAMRSGITFESVCDIENCEGDLADCYSSKEIQLFCQILGIRSIELFGDAISEPSVSAQDLVQKISEECRSRGITFEQFEDVVGWELRGCMEAPERLLEGISIEGLKWLCRELRIDWLRVLSAL